MKGRVLTSVLVSAVVVAAGCDSPQPLAPDSRDFEAHAITSHHGPKVQPVLFWQDLVQDPDAGEIEITDEGVLKARGLVFEGPATGDIVGQAATLTNANIDLSTGEGRAWGRITLTSERGTWKGHFAGKISIVTSLFEGVAVLRGTGAFKGKILKARFTDGCDDGCLSGAPGDGDGLERYKFTGVIIHRR